MWVRDHKGRITAAWWGLGVRVASLLLSADGIKRCLSLFGFWRRCSIGG
jgi:hypothetical protein